MVIDRPPILRMVDEGGPRNAEDLNQCVRAINELMDRVAELEKYLHLVESLAPNTIEMMKFHERLNKP